MKLLEIIGSSETVTPEGRLTVFEICNIEDIYTVKRNFASDSIGRQCVKLQIDVAYI